VRIYGYGLLTVAKIVDMASSSRFSPRSSREKHADEIYGDSNGNTIRNPTEITSGVRARNSKPNAGRTYSNAVGNLGARDEDSTESKESRNGVPRTKTRKRLKEKEKVPGHVQWIKWMHSDWKNRKPSPI
jgi:aquaporin related protein